MSRKPNEDTDMNATFTNTEFNMVTTVTKVKQGYAVTLIDADSEMIVSGRMYPASQYDDAIAYAKFLVQAI